MDTIIYIIIQLGVVLLIAPLINGVIKKVKALSQKRKGAPLLQMYFDLYKLMKKSSVVSDVSSWIYKATPYIVFGTAIAAALLVPVSTTILSSISIPGDFIMLVSIFALGRFFMMAAALDTASTFGGMGSSREAMISSLIEPSMMVSLFAIGIIAQTTSLPLIMLKVQTMAFPLVHPVYMMVGLALLIIIIAETARIPVDDPSTHLELTMVHEAMILEYSGRHLALMEYAASVKQLVLITLFVNILMPHDQWIGAGIAAIGLSLLIYLFKVIFMALVIAVFEVNTVKFKLFSIPNLAALAFILAFLGILQFFILGGNHV
ncbi:NADH-quinone oxidoreductase subunit H [Dehalobacter sp. DCM]|uniref:respiratory chain complex I subunit 1 family protein n=1 Tax=Dehalobacter sp. DCM TaxID=2907827 RepID=UPI0030813049|nr:NADH-quinone oxidoreductase subunit H [Dehalobacter sp. DCM]